MLRAWWEDPENHRAALDIQHHYVLELYRLIDPILANSSSARRSIAVLGRQWEDFKKGMNNRCEKNRMLATSAAGLNSSSRGMATAGPHGHSAFTCTCASCASVRSTNFHRMSFSELAAMVKGLFTHDDPRTQKMA